VHFEPDVSVEGAVMTVPAGQLVAATHATWFSCEELVPAAHGAQTRSLVADGNVAT
jgi:hypothetical protein